MPPDIEQCSGVVGGIYVLSKQLLPEEGQFLNEITSGSSLANERPNTALFKLTDALNAAIGDNSAIFGSCPFISGDRLHVAVWPKWVICQKEPAAADSPSKVTEPHYTTGEKPNGKPVAFAP
jgi:hypothetical protein